jgi:hypothetical protein
MDAPSCRDHGRGAVLGMGGGVGPVAQTREGRKNENPGLQGSGRGKSTILEKH